MGASSGFYWKMERAGVRGRAAVRSGGAPAGVGCARARSRADGGALQLGFRERRRVSSRHGGHEKGERIHRSIGRAEIQIPEDEVWRSN